MFAEKLIAPSAWASYLINGDISGIDALDVQQCDAWIKRVALGLPVSCDDAGFRWHHDADVDSPLGADCQEFIFLQSSGELL